jgi:hypothetical protein
LPARLVRALHRDINLSTPKISMMLAAGLVPSVERVAARAMNRRR